MSDFRWHPSLTVRGFLLSAAAFLVCGNAFAQQISKYIVITPVAVCATDGTNCPIFGASCPLPNAQGLQSCTFFSNPDAATTTTPIGFLDSNTNRNLTRQTWWQAGIDVTFLPIKRYNNSSYQSLTVTCGKSGCDSTGSPSFQMLSQGSPSFPTKAAACTSSCDDPAAATNTANAIYAFFVNSLVPGNGSPSPLYGFGWLNANGVAIASNSFSQLRFDTLAHEIGHNCNLDHTVYGAGQFPIATILGTGPQNLMTAGAYRITPLTTPEAILDVTPPTIPPWKNADYLSLKSDENTRTLKTSEQTACFMSGFLNPSYNSNATAGGGIMAAAATNATTTPSSSGAITFIVDFPAFPDHPNGRPNADIANVVITPPGNFNIVSNSFLVCDAAHATSPPCVGFPTSTIKATAVLVHGNNGVGNLKCAKPLVSGPNQECEVVTIDPTTPFTAKNNNLLVFSTEIDNGSTPITLAQLAGTNFTWVFETDQTDSSGNTTVAERFATTSVFEPPVNNQSAVNSGFPDPTQPSLVLNPDSFVGFTDIPCVLGSNGKCPKATGGNWKDAGSEP